MRILGIETSCDETAAAIVEDGRVVLSSVVSSRVDLRPLRRRRPRSPAGPVEPSPR
jgi:tRNA A37 threonylcarbamoyltransferase TsaD